MNLSDELQKRLDQKPDQWTLAWWEERFQEVLKGYRGATHGINRSLAEYEDACKAIGELRQSVTKTLEKILEDQQADRAKIGELQVRIDRMAEFLTKQKNGMKP
jgi:hypothetical protein